MGKPAYIAGNYLSGAAVTPSSEDSAYPVENLSNGDQSNPFRFTSGASNSLVIDLGEELQVSGILFANHNFVSTATLSVKAGTSPSPSTVVDSPAWAETYILSRFTEGTYRYITIELTDAQDAGDVTEIGELVIGLRVELPRGVRFGAAAQIMQEGIKERTNRGRRYALELYQLQKRIVSFRYPESEEAQFLAWWNAIGGFVDPFVWIEDNDVAAAIYASWDGMGFLPQELSDQAAEPVLELQATMIEESLGAPITA